MSFSFVVRFNANFDYVMFKPTNKRNKPKSKMSGLWLMAYGLWSLIGPQVVWEGGWLSGKRRWPRVRFRPNSKLDIWLVDRLIVVGQHCVWLLSDYLSGSKTSDGRNGQDGWDGWEGRHGVPNMFELLRKAYGLLSFLIFWHRSTTSSLRPTLFGHSISLCCYCYLLFVKSVLLTK